MKLTTTAFPDHGAIPAEFAFGTIDAATHVRLAGNRNPDFAWSDLPPETLSLAIVCHDPDVPSRGDDVNQEGRIVPASLPRVDFFHWTLIDVPPTSRAIEAEAYSKEVTPRGKNGPAAINGTRQGINDYTGWFASDHDMSGDYFGYDGPCPPWNDAIVHHYVFTLYALDLDRVAVDGKFTANDVLRAIEGHVLGKASITGTYTLNPRLA